jgi:hypothetical protein
MATKTNFVNGDPSQGILGTIVDAAWLNKVFNHRHTGLDEDGSAPKINPETEIEGWTNLIVTVTNYKDLTIKNNEVNPNSQIDITIAEIVLKDAAGKALLVSNVNETCDITVSGANGLDTDTEAASTWYHIWAIAKSDGTSAALFSTSSTSPTMPASYTYKAYLGAIYNNSSSDFITLHQTGKTVSIPDVSVLSNGTATSYTAVSLTTAVPTTAKKVYMIVGWSAAGVATKYIYVAPKSNGIGRILRYVDSSGDNEFGSSSHYIHIIEPQTVYYLVSDSIIEGHMTVTGWEY